MPGRRAQRPPRSVRGDELLTRARSGTSNRKRPDRRALRAAAIDETPAGRSQRSATNPRFAAPFGRHNRLRDSPRDGHSESFERPWGTLAKRLFRNSPAPSVVAPVARRRDGEGLMPTQGTPFPSRAGARAVRWRTLANRPKRQRAAEGLRCLVLVRTERLGAGHATLAPHVRQRRQAAQRRRRRHLVATVKRQQPEIRRQCKEIRDLRAKN
jgi:hypothetical protein